MNSKRNLWLALAGAAIVVGFFLPWVDFFGGAVKISGWDALTSNKVGGWDRVMILLVFLCGVALTVTALAGAASARGAALIAGFLIIVYPLFEIVKGFVEVSGVGSWLVLLGGLTALVAGVFGGRSAPRG